MGILAQTCKKRGVESTGKKVGNGKKPSGRFFYLIVEEYVVILLF